jgi:hypothetical protein
MEATGSKTASDVMNQRNPQQPDPRRRMEKTSEDIQAPLLPCRPRVDCKNDVRGTILLNPRTKIQMLHLPPYHITAKVSPSLCTIHAHVIGMGLRHHGCRYIPSYPVCRFLQGRWGADAPQRHRRNRLRRVWLALYRSSLMKSSA